MTPTERAMGFALRGLSRAASSDVLDRLRVRKSTESALYRASRDGFRAAGATARTFSSVGRLGRPARPTTTAPRGLFDLTPTDEQQMMQAACREFAEGVLRPAAAEADQARLPNPETLAQASELGLTLLGVPEECGGAITERAAVTTVLVAESLAWGDMGLALAILAPAAAATALSLWGDADQQSTYLPDLVGDNVPAAAVCLLEPGSLGDPLRPSTTAHKLQDGYLLGGCKTLVPRAADCELLIVSAMLDEPRRPALFLVETATAGVAVRDEPAMGLRSAALGTIQFDDVKLPRSALLGDADPAVALECLRRGRLGWCALAVGVAQAVLDYVTPYVNERVAFGEPVSHRQSVAFAVADIALELEGMRLATLRAAARADAGTEYAREATIARQLCSEQGMQIGSQGVQLLGGHGYVCDHPVERWYRDLRAVGVMEGALLV